MMINDNHYGGDQGGVQGGPGGPRGSKRVKGGVRGVPGGQRRHLISPLMNSKALQVILRVQWGPGACSGVQGVWEGPSGGPRGSWVMSRGSPGAMHGVGLMGFLMNLEAYMPVYKWSRAWSQPTKQPTDPRAGLIWSVKVRHLSHFCNRKLSQIDRQTQ